MKCRAFDRPGAASATLRGSRRAFAPLTSRLALARRNGRRVPLEGVESAEHLAQARYLGIGLAQGFLCRPRCVGHRADATPEPPLSAVAR